MLISRPQKYKKSSNKTTCKQSSIILRPVRSRGWLSLACKRHPSDGPFHFWRNGSLHRSRRWHCPRGVLPARSAFPPIHFGREDGVERTLLRVACQSETFLASPWQGDANIRFLWHIGCQSDFDELVSMACRPVDRGFCRMGETKVPFRPVKWRFARTAELKNVFHPVKGGFGRRKSISMTFRPPKGGFARTKMANHKSSSASEPPHRARRSA